MGGTGQQRVILDCSFVEGKITTTFPNGPDGDPVIMVAKDVTEAHEAVWKKAIVFKVLGYPIAFPVMERKIRDMWKYGDNMQIVDLPNGYFMAKFENEKELLSVLSDGPWSIFGRCLILQRWSPDFATSDVITSAPTWIRITDAPMQWYEETILWNMAAGVGKPIMVDPKTLYS